LQAHPQKAVDLLILLHHQRLLLIATPAIIERWFPSAGSAIRALFSWHWSPSGTVTCVLLLAILLAVGAFTIARAGIASYRR